MCVRARCAAYFTQIYFTEEKCREIYKINCATGPSKSGMCVVVYYEFTLAHCSVVMPHKSPQKTAARIGYALLRDLIEFIYTFLI